MKIYFAGSVRGGRDDAALYSEIISMLSKYGTVLTVHLGNLELTVSGENLPAKQVYDRDVAWLNEADVLIAEVTVPSLGVGYEISKAESAGKKILCLYRPSPGKKISTMLEGDENIRVKEYSLPEELTPIFQEFFGH